jgi:hypothetical protein
MRLVFTLLAVTALAACGRQAADPAVGNVANGVLPAVNCADPSSYDVNIVEGGVGGVDVMSEGKILRPLAEPSASDVSGFKLNWAKKTERGFDIQIEFGDRIYFGKRLIFECRKDAFYLTSVDAESFDKSNLSKKKHKTVDLKPPVPLAKFKIVDQTTDASNAGLYP